MKDSKIIKIGIISLVGVLLLTGICFIIGNSIKGKKASEVVLSFYEAYGRRNKQMIREYVTGEMMKDETVAYFLSDEHFNNLEALDYSLEDVKVESSKKIDKDVIASNADAFFDADLDVTEAYSVRLEYIEKYNKMGEQIENKRSRSIYCGKVDGKWYLLDPDVYTVDEDFDKIAASNTALKFAEGFRDKDVEKIRAQVPEVLSKVSGVDSIFNSGADKALREQDYNIDKLGYLHTDFYVSTVAEKHASEKLGVDLEISDAYTIDIGYMLEQGEDRESLNREIICGKVDGKWYVVDPDQLQHGINFATEYAGYEVGGCDLSTITTILKYDKADSKLGEVPDGMSNDGLDGNISMNGTVYDLPFCVSDLTDGWEVYKDTFRDDYKKLSPGEYAYSNTFKNTEYPKFYGLMITTLNMTEKEIAFEESSVVSVDMDVRSIYSDGAYPVIVLPKGITIGSSLADLYESYGEAEYIYMAGFDDGAYVSYRFYESEDDGYTSCSYDFYVDFEEGVQSIDVFYFEY